MSSLFVRILAHIQRTFVLIYGGGNHTHLHIFYIVFFVMKENRWLLNKKKSTLPFFYLPLRS